MANPLAVLLADLGLEVHRPATTHPGMALTVEVQLTRDEDKLADRST